MWREIFLIFRVFIYSEEIKNRCKPKHLADWRKVRIEFRENSEKTQGVPRGTKAKFGVASLVQKLQKITTKRRTFSSKIEKKTKKWVKIQYITFFILSLYQRFELSTQHRLVWASLPWRYWSPAPFSSRIRWTLCTCQIDDVILSTKLRWMFTSFFYEISCKWYYNRKYMDFLAPKGW